MAAGKEQPHTAREIHRQLHRKQFSAVGGGGIHRYDTLSLITLGNNRLKRLERWHNVPARTPASYDRIMAMQPLPSTASDLAGRDTAVQGPSMQASVHRLLISHQVQSWQRFAAQHEKSRRVSSSSRHEARLDGMAGEQGTSGGPYSGAPVMQPHGDGEVSQRHLVANKKNQQKKDMKDDLLRFSNRALASSRSARSMFDLLQERKTTVAAEAPPSSEDGPCRFVEAESSPAKPKTNMMKKKEMLEAKDRKRPATRSISQADANCSDEAMMSCNESCCARQKQIHLARRLCTCRFRPECACSSQKHRLDRTCRGT
jgi:hypothetical protein